LLHPRRLKLCKDQIVYIAGLPAEAVYAVRSGSVSLVLSDILGNERIVRFVHPGHLFGLDSLLPRKTYFFTATTREDADVCFIPRTEFEDFVRCDRERMWRLLLVLDMLAHDGELDSAQLSTGPVRRRLKYAMTILDASSEGKPRCNGAVTPLRQRELAQFIGAAEETVSREMKKLRRR
jgi:CRP-like cAMP-binding protein